MHIIDILLEDVHVTKDSCFQKSRILIAKGRALRALGAEGLNDCIQCLSEAISTMVTYVYFSSASLLFYGFFKFGSHFIYKLRLIPLFS